MHLNGSSITERREALVEDFDELVLVQSQASPSEDGIIRRIHFFAFCQPLSEDLRAFGETDSELSLESCKGSKLGAKTKGSRPLMSASQDGDHG